MKGRRLTWSVDVCSGDAVGSVSRGFCYLTFFFDDLLFGCGADGQHPVLEVWIMTALRSALPPVSSVPLTLTVAIARAIAAVARVVNQLLTVEALYSAWNLLLTLSELRATARCAWLRTECFASAWATSSATTKVDIACRRLFTATKREPTRATARATTSETEAGHRTRLLRRSWVVTCDTNPWLWKSTKLGSLGKSLGSFENDALARHFVVQTVDKLFDQNMLEHRRVRRFRVGAMSDQLDVAGKRLDALARFLTPKVENFSQFLRGLSNGEVVFQLRFCLVKGRGLFETEVLCNFETLDVK